uniref:Transmembrane protein n=1 Tax=Lepeophtheirus salmonis TaxID=72036 RepID=A0A0K2T3H4_LEPSM
MSLLYQLQIFALGLRFLVSFSLRHMKITFNPQSLRFRELQRAPFYTLFISLHSLINIQKYSFKQQILHMFSNIDFLSYSFFIIMKLYVFPLQQTIIFVIVSKNKEFIGLPHEKFRFMLFF